MRSRQLLFLSGAFIIIALVSILNLRSRDSDILPFRLHGHDATTTSASADVDYWTWDTTSHFHPQSPRPDTRDPCISFPQDLLSRVQVVLKIGSSEPHDRLDAQVSSVSRCISNLLIVSDRDQTIGEHRAYDVLADLPPSYKTNNSDFDVYNGAPVQGPDKAAPGWRLDRYKFLPMVERAHRVNPTADWFVLLEADTYIVWDNLFRLLDHFDPHVPLYMGSPAPGRRLENGKTTWFAFGGTGIVLSSAALDRLLSRRTGQYGEFVQPSLTEKYENIVKGDSCGDSILGWALYEAGIELSGLWPLFNPHPFHSVPFSDAYWCQPVISTHRSSPDEMKAFSKWENQRGWTKPLLYADLFDYMHFGSFSFRSDWDNANFHGFRGESSSPAHSSFDACAQACRDHPECFQYTYDSSGLCTFVRSIRLGLKHVDPARNVRLSAGWDVDRINEWARERQCESPHWVKPSLTRIF